MKLFICFHVELLFGLNTSRIWFDIHSLFVFFNLQLIISVIEGSIKLIRHKPILSVLKITIIRTE